MKKSIQTLLLAFSLSGTSLLAQEQQTVMPCATYDAMEAAFQADPTLRAKYEAEQEKLRLATLEYEESLKNKKVGAAFQYTIPVVFHILHENGAENISDANCIAALANINNDYSAAGSDVGTISPLFSSLYINSDIKFMLAHKDPSGNCTSGINHYYNTGTNWNQASPSYAYSGTGATQWNPTKYLNIYVVKSICPNTATCSSSGGVIVGYTYKPGTWPAGNSRDAFVIRSGWVSNNYIDSRTLSHEIGHWLNLSHTFGNTNNPGVSCGDDGIADTPMTKGYFSTCPSSASGNTCVGSGQANVENIMDYSSCPKMFTAGQTNVMRAALASSTSGRNNLWATANLTATDVNGTGICAPIADFHSVYGTAVNVYTVCAGSTLNFIDDSYNGAVTGRAWTATGGASIANPTGASTGITFSSVGTQTVTLTVNNAQGSSVKTKTVNVISGVANVSGSYQESFETAGLPTNWTIINQTGGTTWQQNTGAAASGSNSYYMNNTINPGGAIDILETPSYNFAANSGATFTFKYAYAQYNGTWADVFKVQASSNCGGSWTDIYVPSPSTMASGSGGVTTTPFTPTPAQFKLYTLTSHPAFNTFKTQPNVKIRFYFQENTASGFGNNFYLDDINFNSPLSVNELSQSIGLSLYPNPTNASAHIAFTLSDNAEIKVSVTDLLGKTVENDRVFNLNPGQHSVTVNEFQQLKSGMYIVNVEMNGQKITRKLIIE